MPRSPILVRTRPAIVLPRFRSAIFQLRALGMAVACTAFALSAGLAGAEPDALQQRLQKLGYTVGDSVEQVRDYRVDGWNYIDDKNIMIYAGPSKRFLITTQIPCNDLGSAENIGFSSTVGNVTKFDKLIVRGPGGIVQNCPIERIRALEKIKTGA
jgi:hypothetical protein